MSTKAWRDHVGEPCTYDHRAFGKRHNDDIAVLPCTLGEPVCGDERANNGVPFFYFYQVVFKRIGMRLPFSRFERELLTEINIAPAQLHPNGWAFVKAFGVLCGFFGCTPSVDIFLHFFEVKKQGKSLWVSLSNILGRVLLSLFQQSFKGWKGKFFKVCCSDYDPSALDGFPLYWVNEVKTMKSKSLDELPSNDREACKILTSVGGFDTATLISLEFNADALEKYISMNVSSYDFLGFALARSLLNALFSCFFVFHFRPMPNFCHVCFIGVGSKMDRQRRLHLAQLLRPKDGALVSPPSASSAPPSSPNPQPQPATTPTNPTTPASPRPLPSSPPPIAAVPLALVEAGASSAPLDKGKRVVEVLSDDEDSVEGQVFK